MFSHLYIWLALYFLCWWIFLFLWRKDYRSEMLTMGLIGIVLGPLVEFMHLTDWWHPLFIFNNFLIRPEDVIFGFSIAGVSAVIYQELRAIKEFQQNKLIPTKKYELLVLLIGLFTLFGLYIFFGVHSFWTSILCLITTALLVLIKRRDLFYSMFFSGILITGIAIPFYIFALHINPFWFQQEWFLGKLSGIFFLNIPIEELVWYFFIGLTFSAMWEFMNGLKFVFKKRV